MFGAQRKVREEFTQEYWSLGQHLRSLSPEYKERIVTP
jgi:hypothetical protein